MSNSENDRRIMSTTLNLRPGTHHLKFIVDGDMRASDNLPTAVDFTNHLVNYIEVSPDDVHRSHGKVTVPPGIHPPQVLPDLLRTETIEDNVKESVENEEPEEEIPLGDFRRIIPQFLVDLDKEEEDPAYQQAANVIGDASAPPSLPLFLGKSILNGTTPMKDDSSVLNYPNHTVLNHLATSSIKNGVLATSVTTRYKRKVNCYPLCLVAPSLLLTLVRPVRDDNIVQAHGRCYGLDSMRRHDIAQMTFLYNMRLNATISRAGHFEKRTG